MDANDTASRTSSPLLRLCTRLCTRSSTTWMDANDTASRTSSPLLRFSTSPRRGRMDGWTQMTTSRRTDGRKVLRAAPLLHYVDGGHPLLHYSASPLYRFSTLWMDGWTDGVLRRDFVQAVRMTKSSAFTSAFALHFFSLWEIFIHRTKSWDTNGTPPRHF
jgi:hypothetical protein